MLQVLDIFNISFIIIKINKKITASYDAVKTGLIILLSRGSVASGASEAAASAVVFGGIVFGNKTFNLDERIAA